MVLVVEVTLLFINVYCLIAIYYVFYSIVYNLSLSVCFSALLANKRIHKLHVGPIHT